MYYQFACYKCSNKKTCSVFKVNSKTFDVLLFSGKTSLPKVHRLTLHPTNLDMHFCYIESKMKSYLKNCIYLISLTFINSIFFFKES